MNQKINISVVMPSFNEEEAIPKMIESIRANTRDYETEIVLVDSSQDNTPKIASDMGARVIFQEPKGHGIALRKAILEAKNDIIITSDCDNTYPMDYIPMLVDLVQNQNFDLISCNRLTKHLGKEMPFSNKLANMGFAFLVRTLYGIKTHDVSTGMFAISKKLKNNIQWESNYSLPCEIIIRSNLSGFNYKQIDIPYRLRTGEVTLNKWRSGKAYLKCIFNYRFNLGIPADQL